ncbi:hypothetical protein [Haloarcula onubensis]|uniref:Halobacterial output domain-containing protein n=1 Tax=Haloarcula onubensis TaxID=2950539 RepID=A0ABU2FN06_9EURY|nr:hypothetical protein [Halomicroarcula sp. S3CR25-11]MDS0282145.1 hypothetical protein [Halomicroarcula sp. S3CR25-11]
MFDKVLEASKQKLSAGVSDETAVDEETLAELSTFVPDDETVEHGLLSAGDLTWTRGGREETRSPGPDGYVFLLVTERRVRVVVGGADPSEPVPTLPLGAVTAAEYRRSLLSSSFIVETADQRVSFSPVGDDSEAVADYIGDAAEGWQQMDAAIENAREVLAAYQDEDGTFDDLWRVGKQVRSQTKTAARATARDSDAVTAHLRRIFEPIAADLARELRSEAHRSASETDIAEDGASETYQQARKVMVFAMEIIEEHTTVDVSPFEESLEALDDDISRSEWQWGGAE